MHESSRYLWAFANRNKSGNWKEAGMEHGARHNCQQFPPWGSVQVRERISSVDSELGEQLAGGRGPTLGRAQLGVRAGLAESPNPT